MRINRLADKRITATISLLQDGTTKLILVYPREPEYRDRVLGALSDILRHEDVPPAQPPPSQEAEG